MARVPYRHAIGTVCGYQGQPLAVLGVHRRSDDADFDAADLAVIDRIAPHLGRALALRAWWGEPLRREKTALLAFASGELCFMNKAAQGLLCRSSKALASSPSSRPPARGSCDWTTIAVSAYAGYRGGPPAC